MLPKGEILRRLYEFVSPLAKGILVQEFRIGLSYVGVKLNDDRMGLAALLLYDLPPGCSIFPEAGLSAGVPASIFLEYLYSGKSPLERALGLAAANAILSSELADDTRDSLSIIQLTEKDRVAMVGLFSPMVPKIEATGAKLSVIERNPARMAVLDRADRDRILGECTVAIITATTLLNDTLEEVLEGLREPRHVAMLGPSTPLCIEIFADTPVNHLGGAIVRNAEKIMQIISEGGGTPAMRPYLRFVNLVIPKTA